MINKASKLVQKIKPNNVIVLGDRYEIFAFSLACFLQKIPIIHLAGGEKTPNNYDDVYRDLISKISHIHLVTNNTYRKNLLKLGILKKNIFDVGSLGIDNLFSVKKTDPKKIFQDFNIRFSKKYFLITYHPTTNLSKQHNLKELKNLLEALKKFKEYTLIFTYPGSDLFSNIIIEKIKNFCLTNNHAYLIKSFGSDNYINLARNSSLVIGNSSSGLSEIPSLKKISINIGLRQKGRLFGKSVINTSTQEKNIFDSIRKGLKLSKNKVYCSGITNPYGNGKSCNKILKILDNLI